MPFVGDNVEYNLLVEVGTYRKHTKNRTIQLHPKQEVPDVTFRVNDVTKCRFV